ncbi:MAG: orotidine 5'-phosphate decarboxylase / HUMPS family protein [Atribacterota bacterium]
MRVLLQIALDILTKEEVRSLICPEVLSAVDIVEVGTPLIVRYGLSMVEKVKEWTDGRKLIFADTKIVDAGRWETTEALAAGADLVSVLAGASPFTLEEVREQTRTANALMVVDTIDLFPHDTGKIDYLRHLQPDYLCLHLSTDAVKKGKTLLDFSRELPFAADHSLPLMMAGGVKLSNLQEILQNTLPAVVVAGSSLTGVSDPGESAHSMRRIIDEFVFSRSDTRHL